MKPAEPSDPEALHQRFKWLQELFRLQRDQEQRSAQRKQQQIEAADTRFCRAMRIQWP